MRLIKKYQSGHPNHEPGQNCFTCPGKNCDSCEMIAVYELDNCNMKKEKTFKPKTSKKIFLSELESCNNMEADILTVQSFLGFKITVLY